MKKLTWFILQFVWSAVYTFYWMYEVVMHIDFSFGGGDNSEANAFLLGGLLLYVLLSAVYTLVGRKVVKDDKTAFVPFSVLVAMMSPPLTLSCIWLYFRII